MSSIDDVDHAIISTLLKDSRTPYTEIAKRVGLSEAGVRKRIDRLVKMGVIKRFTVEVEYGARLKAISLISVDPSIATPQVSERVREVDGVERVYEVTGVYDIVAVISALTMSEINRCIDDLRKIEGVKNSNTMIVLKEW